jgi:hypothetical protein
MLEFFYHVVETHKVYNIVKTLKKYLRTNFYEKTEFDMKMCITKIDRNRTKIWQYLGPPGHN